MPLAGKQVMARDHAKKARVYWQNYELTKAIATALAESNLFLGAYHDNLDSDGNVLSRDCGIYEFNIPARDIGSDREFSLRTESHDPMEYEPVWDTSVALAKEYYDSRWNRDGKIDIRRWQAWAGYTSGWATFPYAWIWHQVDGEPVGPWVPVGRYIFRAIAGQMNNLIVNEKIWTPENGLFYAKRYAEHFGIQDGSFPLIVTDRLGNKIISWAYTDTPLKRPADGIGPRPVPNDGV